MRYLPDMDDSHQWKQFHHHRGTEEDLEYKFLENHKSLDKDIASLSSLSSHNLEIPIRSWHIIGRNSLNNWLITRCNLLLGVLAVEETTNCLSVSYGL